MEISPNVRSRIIAQPPSVSDREGALW